MAMIRSRVASDTDEPMRLLYSARSEEDIIYRQELDSVVATADGIDVVYTLTRSQPPGWDGLSPRVDRAMLEEVAWLSSVDPVCFVCGPTGFVETVASNLVELGHPPNRLRTERFGPTGGPS